MPRLAKAFKEQFEEWDKRANKVAETKHNVRAIPSATSLNESEGWTAQYDFVEKLRRRLIDSEPLKISHIPSMEGIDMVITELQKLGMVSLSYEGILWEDEVSND